jgi:hypothetical protein
MLSLLCRHRPRKTLRPSRGLIVRRYLSRSLSHYVLVRGRDDEATRVATNRRVLGKRHLDLLDARNPTPLHDV